ncbi:MAG TPA: MarR family transcriptional regulator [Candidatus Dormibacteraeota bacterium]
MRSLAMVTDRPTPLSVLLSAAERALAVEVEGGLRAAGYTDLRAAHAQVFVAIDVEGSRLTDLAARAGMTKQAMGELVRYLEQHGYLEVEPDSRDRRAKVIRPTPAGRRAHEISVSMVSETDRRLADRIGEQALHDLRTQVRRIAEGARRQSG